MSQYNFEKQFGKLLNGIDNEIWVMNIEDKKLKEINKHLN